MKTATIWSITLLGLLLAATAAAEPLYVCGGTPPLYTNRAELGCPVYEPGGRLRTAPPGATWAEIKLLAVGPSTSEAPAERSGSDKAAPAQDTPCALYREWAALNARTQGGFYSLTTEERQRWMGLQKIFSLAGVPHCPE